MRPSVALWLVLLAVLGSGCLGAVDPEAPETAFQPITDELPKVSVVSTPEEDPGILRIQGDDMLDRSARRFGWSGTGSFASPYLIPDLELKDTLLVFQDLTRAVTLQGASLKAPADGPALLVWNVTAFTVIDSDIEAYDGPAVSFLESSWSRIEGSALKSQKEAVQGIGSEAIDLLDNDLRSGTTAIRFEHDLGDHWIERNRVHQSKIAFHLHDSQRSSSLFDNMLRGETGAILSDTTAPLLEGNHILAHDALRIERTPGALLIDTVLEATGTGVTVTDSSRLLVDTLKISGTARGVSLHDSPRALVANLTYEGPGPAVASEGGDTTVIVDAYIILPTDEGEGILLRNEDTPTILDGEIAGGRHAIRLNQSTDGAIIGTRIGDTRGDAIVLEATEASLVAETWVQAVMGHGIAIHGGERHQMAENRFEYTASGGIAAWRTTDLDVAFNTFERGTGTPILIDTAIRPLVESNELSHTVGGIWILNAIGGNIRGNNVSDAAYGIKIEHQDHHPLRITNNRIAASSLQAVVLTDANDAEIRGNALYSHKTGARGLVLTDVQNGLVYDNYFDNALNVVASGELGVQWFVERQNGTNIVGDDTIAGNWWNDYSGADANDDGIGETPHGVLPYEKDLGIVPVPNYGVSDEYPIVSTGIPQPPLSHPAPSPVGDRLSSLMGLHDLLDRILGQRT